MTCGLNPKTLGGKRRKQRGGGGATGYVGCVTGGMNQVTMPGRGNELAYKPIGGCITGGSRRRSRSHRRKSSKRGGTLFADIAIPAGFLWANTTFGSRGKSRTSKRRSSRRY